MSTYVVSDARPAIEPVQCQARRCWRTIRPGQLIVMVHHVRRSLAQPDAQDAHAYLCGHCASPFPDAPVRTEPLTSVGFLYRGRPVEPW